MQLTLLIISAFAVKLTQTYDAKPAPSQAGLLERKIEPKFKYGDTKGVLACSLFYKTKLIGDYNISWMKDSIPVKNLMHSERFVLGKNNTLVINYPKRSDAGVYTAVFRHVYGQLPDYTCQVQYFAEPLVLDFLKSVNIPEGGVLDLKCQVKGHPRAEIHWYKNGANLTDVLKNSFRLHMMSLDGYVNAHLVLKSIRMDDAGIYKCEAHSTFFNISNSKQILVRVKDKMEFLWPLLGLIGSFILLCLIIVTFDAVSQERFDDPEPPLIK